MSFLNDSINFVGALQGMDRHREHMANSAAYEKRAQERHDVAMQGTRQNMQKTNEQYEEGKAQDAAYEKALRGIQEEGPDKYKPDTKDPAYRAKAYQQAVRDSLKNLSENEKFKEYQMTNAVARAAKQRQDLTKGFKQAWGVYQADPERGYSELLKIYDHYHDGLTLVKDANGQPMIDPKSNTIKIRNLSGKIADVPAPPAADIYNMAQGILKEGALEEQAPLNEERYRQYNASRIWNGTFFESEDGQVIVKYEGLVSPDNRNEEVTKVLDIDSQKEITPEEFAKKKWRQVFVGDDKQRAKENLEKTKAAAKGSKAEGPGSPETKRKLDMLLMPFAPNKGMALFDFNTGQPTDNGANALQAAMEAVETLQAKSQDPKAGGLSIPEKKKLDSAMRAVAYFEFVQNQIVPQGAISPENPPQEAPPAPAPGGEGGKPLDRETALQFLKQAGGDKAKARELATQAGYQF